MRLVNGEETVCEKRSENRGRKARTGVEQTSPSPALDEAVQSSEPCIVRRPDGQKLRVLSVFGTRPEAIKMAPVITELQRTPEVESRVCVTAQHREMLDQVLELFDIRPDYDLDLMRKNQSLSQLSARVLTMLEPIFGEARPDWILVQGDTTTAALAALAAFYGRVKIGHIEAGLRSHNKWGPYPEEINRRVAGVVADLHFAPTESARRNLLVEGIHGSQIFVTGNTIIDALRLVQLRAWDPSPLRDAIQGLDPQRTKIIIVTAHRRENFGEPIIQICEALRRLANQYGDRVRFFYPVHRNPNISDPVHRLLSRIPNIILSDPLEYLPLVHLMKRSYLVLTDSGGIQEEAPALGIPALVLRDVTERPEAVASGNVRLVGTDPNRIVEEVSRLLDNRSEHKRMAQAANPYGDGHAAKRIVRALCMEKAPKTAPAPHQCPDLVGRVN